MAIQLEQQASKLVEASEHEASVSSELGSQLAQVQLELDKLREERDKKTAQIVHRALLKYIFRTRLTRMVKLIRSAKVGWALDIHTEFCVLKEWIQTESVYLSALESVSRSFFPAIAPMTDLIENAGQSGVVFDELVKGWNSIFEAHRPVYVRLS